MNRTVLWPKLPEAAKRRPLLEAWLSTNAGKRIRILLAPAGWGKTGTLLRYAAKSGRDAAYCRIPENCMADEFLERFALAVNLPFCNDEHEMERALAQLSRPTEIILDDLDRADVSTIESFKRIAKTAPSRVKFIAGVRSADRFGDCGPDCAFS